MPSVLDTPCEQCGCPLRQHYDGICGSRGCTAWLDLEGSVCPDAAARGRAPTREPDETSSSRRKATKG